MRAPVLFLLLTGCGPTASPPPPPAPVAVTQVPEIFRGRWAVVGASCRTGDRRMVVDARTLAFYESLATLRSGVQFSPETVRLDLAFTGEGQRWTGSTTLALSGAGSVLDRSEPGRPPISYRRCLLKDAT